MSTSALSLPRLLCALALTVLAGSAHANEVTLQLFEAAGQNGPDGDLDTTVAPTMTIARGYRLVVTVTRSAGAWSDARVVLDGTFGHVKTATNLAAPDVLSLRSITTGGVVFSHVAAPGTLTPTWSLPDLATAEAITTQFEYWFTLDSQSTRHGTPITTSARLIGTRDGAPVDVASATLAHTAEAPLAVDPWFRTAYSIGVGNFDHPTLGAGVRVRYALQLYNQGRTALRSAGPTTPSHELWVAPGAKLHPIRMASYRPANAWWEIIRIPSDGVTPPIRPGADELDFASTLTFANPIVQDFALSPSLSYARSFATTSRGIYADANVSFPEHVNPHGYDGTTDMVIYDVFVSCEDLEPELARTGPEWELGVWGVARDVTFSGAVRSTTVGSALEPHKVAFPLQQVADSCLRRGSRFVTLWPWWNDPYNRWIGGKTIGVGAEATFEVWAAAPYGATDIEGGSLIQKLPPGSDFRVRPPSHFGYAHLAPGCSLDSDCEGRGVCIDGQCEDIYGLRAYYCDTPNDFGHDGFLALRLTGACVPAVVTPGGHVPPADFGRPTHFVFHSQTYDGRPWNDDAVSQIYYTVHFTTAADSGQFGPSSEVIKSQLWMSGHYDLGQIGAATYDDREITTAPYDTNAVDPYTDPDSKPTNPNNLSHEDRGFYRLVDYQCVHVSPWSPRVVIAPHECTDISFNVYPRDANPLATDFRFELGLPSTFSVAPAGDGQPINPPYISSAANDGVSMTYYGASTACPGATSGTIAEPSASGPRPLTWTYAGGCGLPTLTSFQVRVCPDPTHPYIDGEQLQFSGTAAWFDHAAGPGDLCPAGYGGVGQAASLVITMAVEGQQVTSAIPACREDGFGFTAMALNSGGAELTGVELAFELPANTSFVGVAEQEPPLSELEVRTSTGAWVPLGAIANEDVAAVRMVGQGSPLSLTPYSGEASFVVLLTSTAPIGQGLVASSTMRSNELGETVASSAPYIVGSCQPLTIRKFFDADGDGLRGPDEQTLSGFAFHLENEAGLTVATGTTDGAGQWTLLLPAGTYTLHETLPTSNSATWENTTPQALPIALVLGGTGTTIEFGNRCFCETDNTCSEPGECRPLGGTNASCSPSKQLDCNDGNLCTTDFCDPGTEDGCVHEWVDCSESGGLFAPITDTSGAIVGAIRCAIVGNTIACDTDPVTGELIVYPELGNACATP